MRQVQNWVKQKGCPRLKHGLYDLRAVFRWYLETIVNACSEEESDAKRKYMIWKAEGQKMSVEIDKGLYILASDVESKAFEAGRLIKEQCMAIADRCAPMVAASNDQFECKQIIVKEVTYILEGIADALSVR